MSDSASVPVIGTKGKKRRRLAVSGAWKENEDELLMKAMAEAPKNWKHAEGIVGRTAKQCRDRYRLRLDPPSINHGPWDRVEDEKLLQYHKVYGNQWMNISLHLPGRTENSVKSRYISLIRKASKKRRTSETAPSSRFRGVSFSKSDQKRKAQITRDGGRKYHLGYFADEKEAPLACDAKARELQGEGAFTNFDDVTTAAAVPATASSSRLQRSAVSSRFRGVYFHRASQKWQAKINHGLRHYHLGLFKDEREAALAYDAKARELKGEGAVTNFNDVAAAAAVAATVSSHRAQRFSSRFRGVCFNKREHKWKAQIHYGGRKYNVGEFADEKEAALAYDAKARELKGEGAVTNFDDVAAAAAVAATLWSRRAQRPAAVSSRFRGVSFNRGNQKWVAKICHGGRRYTLGFFTDEKEAALAYDAKARELKGEGAVTNFDDVAAAAAVVATVSSRREQRAASVSSRFRGVSFYKGKKTWRAGITHGGRKYHLGYFTDEKEAALAYDAKARELQGEGAVTNFDDVAAAAGSKRRRSGRRTTACGAGASLEQEGVTLGDCAVSGIMSCFL